MTTIEMHQRSDVDFLDGQAAVSHRIPVLVWVATAIFCINLVVCAWFWYSPKLATDSPVGLGGQAPYGEDEQKVIMLDKPSPFEQSVVTSKIPKTPVVKMTPIVLEVPALQASEMQTRGAELNIPVRTASLTFPAYPGAPAVRN